MIIRAFPTILAVAILTFGGCKQSSDSSGGRSRTVAYRQPTDSGAETEGKLVTSLFGGVPPSVRKPALANPASCSGLRMKRANSLAALTCSGDSQLPLSSTVGKSAMAVGPGGNHEVTLFFTSGSEAAR